MSGESILFVDDERPILVMMKLLLRHLGHGCEAVENPAVALERFRKDPGRYDLVITDFTMPGMNGNKLARKMIEVRPDLPILICSGDISKVHQEEAHRIGVAGILGKPMEREHLAAAIQIALGKPNGAKASLKHHGAADGRHRG